MVTGRIKLAAVFLALSLVCAVTPLLAGKKNPAFPAAPASDPTKIDPTKSDLTKSDLTKSGQRRALQALNRLTFGPRPGDLQQVMAEGVDKWIDLQLHPERINDAPLDARLEPFRTLRMNTRELAENFPDNEIINQIKNGKRSMPSDPALRMIYRIQLARLEEKKQRAQEVKAAAVPGSANQSQPSMSSGAETLSNSVTSAPASDISPAEAMAPSPKPVKMTAADEGDARQREEKLYTDLEIQKLPGLPPDQRYKQILAMTPETQLAFADTIRGGKAKGKNNKDEDFLAGLNPKQKEILQAMNNPPGVVTSELMQAKLVRAIYSNRQLDEVMTDFWFNHFNVFIEKGVDRLMVTSYERDVIRPHALGKFEDLLVATAKSPAMLFYLDNFLSVGPNSAQALGVPPGPYNRRNPMRPRPNGGKRSSGLNENYGRELLELHTLSVNGGYSQHDVTEVAKVFTGWTIDKPADGATFKFDPRMHEPGPKFVLGRKIKFNGEKEGLEVLHRLATSPQTAHFVCLKLAERFVSDDPPPALVDRMAKTFLKKKGDIREVLSALFHSPEFWDDSTYRAKVKTPLEFVASAARATNADIEDPLPLVRQLNNMGMPLYGAQPPTGYSMKAETWVSSSALLNRMNFALAFTNGKIKGSSLDAPQMAGIAPDAPAIESSQLLSALEIFLLDGDVSKETHDSIAAQINASPNPTRKAGKQNNPDSTHADANTIAGLLLGSPEFQRR